MFAVKQSQTLIRAKREVALLEAILNETTECDRMLMELSLQTHGLEIFEFIWQAAITRIRAEFHRLRRKKGKPE